MTSMRGARPFKARALARHLIGEPDQVGLFDDGRKHLTVPGGCRAFASVGSWQFPVTSIWVLVLWRGTRLGLFV